MLPDLFSATQEYWRNLDALEEKYQAGELSLAEVDAEVARLMNELGEERRRSLRAFMQILKTWFNEQQELVYGLGLLAVVTYGWVVSTTLS